MRNYLWLKFNRNLSILQKYSNLIVGPKARLVSKENGFFHYSAEIQNMYNIILTGCAFLHVDYHHLFFSLPYHVHQFIEERKNCEDIAINFLASSLCGCTAGHHVKRLRPVAMFPSSNSLSAKTDHLVTRNECCNYLAKEFGLISLKAKLKLVWQNQN